MSDLAEIRRMQAERYRKHTAEIERQESEKNKELSKQRIIDKVKNHICFDKVKLAACLISNTTKKKWFSQYPENLESIAIQGVDKIRFVENGERKIFSLADISMKLYQYDDPELVFSLPGISEDIQIVELIKKNVKAINNIQKMQKIEYSKTASIDGKNIFNEQYYVSYLEKLYRTRHPQSDLSHIDIQCLFSLMTKLSKETESIWKNDKYISNSFKKLIEYSEISSNKKSNPNMYIYKIENSLPLSKTFIKDLIFYCLLTTEKYLPFWWNSDNSLMSINAMPIMLNLSKIEEKLYLVLVDSLKKSFSVFISQHFQYNMNINRDSLNTRQSWTLDVNRDRDSNMYNSASSDDDVLDSPDRYVPTTNPRVANARNNHQLSSNLVEDNFEYSSSEDEVIERREDEMNSIQTFSNKSECPSCFNSFDNSEFREIYGCDDFKVCGSCFNVMCNNVEEVD